MRSTYRVLGSLAVSVVTASAPSFAQTLPPISITLSVQSARLTGSDASLFIRLSATNNGPSPLSLEFLPWLLVKDSKGNVASEGWENMNGWMNVPLPPGRTVYITGGPQTYEEIPFFTGAFPNGRYTLQSGEYFSAGTVCSNVVNITTSQ